MSDDSTNTSEQQYRATCTDGDSTNGTLTEVINWTEKHLSMLESLNPDETDTRIEIQKVSRESSADNGGFQDE